MELLYFITELLDLLLFCSAAKVVCMPVNMCTIYIYVYYFVFTVLQIKCR